jgi:hypothetical protein
VAQNTFPSFGRVDVSANPGGMPASPYPPTAEAARPPFPDPVTFPTEFDDDFEFLELRIPDGREALVLTFDMQSSTSILRILAERGRMHLFKDFHGCMKRYLGAIQRRTRFVAYKFTGDGWLLLFPASVPGDELLRTMRGVARYYQRAFNWHLRPSLDHTIKAGARGLTFGVDRGPLTHFRMFKRDEYVSRAINVACRLQGKVATSNTALISGLVYDECFGSQGVDPGKRRYRDLKNFSKRFRCYEMNVARWFPERKKA